MTLLNQLARLGLIAVLGVATKVTLAAAPQVRTQSPGFYRMMVGDIEVTALLDGTHPFPVDEVMTNAPPGTVSRLLAMADVDRPVEGSINAFLLNTGARLILVDSGAGALYGACCGRLQANLRAAGYTPEQVDEVLLTHLHRDHVGGLDGGGRMAFPNATVHVARADADYWLDRANERTAPPFLGSMWDGAIVSLKAYVDAGRLKTFEPGAMVLPGIRSVSAPGHTPGHSWYVVESLGQTLVVWGDTVHVAPLQFPNPGIRLKYDSDQDAAETARRQIFRDAAKGRWWIAAAHVSFPGLGHVVSGKAAAEWVPAPYTTWLVLPSGAARRAR